MDTYIKSNSSLIDIHSEQARNNFNSIVEYLKSSMIPDHIPSVNMLGNVTLLEGHNYVASKMYRGDVAILVNNVLQNRTKISNLDNLNGISYIYELDRDTLVEVESNRFFESIAILEHELIHIVQALNNNIPEDQYMEYLSIFGELLTLTLLSERYSNPDIYINSLIRRCVYRISCRVYVSDFEDESLQKQREGILDSNLKLYNYMIGFIYAVRLLELYYLDPDKVLTDFNLILAGKKKVKELLTEYHISLEDEETINSFMQMIDSYQDFVEMKCGSSVHVSKW